MLVMSVYQVHASAADPITSVQHQKRTFLFGLIIPPSNDIKLSGERSASGAARCYCVTFPGTTTFDHSPLAFRSKAKPVLTPSLLFGETIA